MNPGWFTPPAPPPGWGLPPFFPQLLQMPPDRLERWHRIGPIFPVLKEGLIPKSMPVPVLEKVLSDVKEEGNACFKDKDYNGAYEMYTCALHICKSIQTVHYSNVDRELLSAIFSNRAACSLKMDVFKESIQDCEIAIQQNADNIKAHYRMAVAYKSLKDYGSALRSAGVGRRQAEKLKKNKEMKEFDDLIREVESHMPSAESVATPHAANQKSRSQPLLKKSSVMETASKSSPQKASQGKGIADQPKSKAKGEKAKNPAKKGSSSAAEIGKSKEVSSDVKKKDDNVPKKKVKKKVIPKKSQYQGKFSILDDANDSDDEGDGDDGDGDGNGHDNEEEEQMLVKDQEGLIRSDVGSRTVMGLDEFEQFSSPTKHAKSAVSIASDGRTNSSQHGDYSLRSLHEKFLSDARAESQSPAGSLSHGVFMRTKSPLGAGLSQHPYPPGYESWSFSPGQQVPGQNIRSIPNLMHVVPQPSTSLQQKQIFKADQNSKYGDFECIRTRAANQFPFDGKYDLTLACDQCYVQTGHGDAGYVCFGKLDHDCERNAFLIRQYGSPECRWQKIRPRDQRATFYGPFRLCRDYGFSRPCRSAEKDCSFAHSDEEVRLWTLDRERQFNLAEFVAELRSHVKKSSVPLVSQQHPGMTFTNSTFVNENFNSDFHQQQNNVPPFTPNQQTPYDFSLRYNQSEVKTNENTSRLFGAASTTSNFTQAATWARAAAPKEAVAGRQPYQDPTSWARAAASKESLNVQQQLYQNQENIQSARIVFPLGQYCNFHLVCNKCFLPLSEFREYYFWNAGVQHTCSEDILAVQPMGANAWVRIRERINHREFRGNYMLCRHFETGKPRGCRHQESCQFAHNPEEQFLWTREKDGQFDIAEFIRQNRSRSAVPLFSVVGVLEKFPGEVRHLCAACLHVHHTLSTQSPSDPTRCNRGEHAWLENRVLIHFSPSRGITEVRPRPFKTKTAFFKLCQNQRFCRLRNLGKCSYAHSVIEREIWCLERDLDLSQDQIVDEVAKLNLQKYLLSTGAVKPSDQPDKSAKASPNSHTKQGSPAPSVELSASPDSAPKCPYNVIEVCKLCFQNGAISGRKNNRCDGSGLGHIWDQNKMCLIMPSKKRLSTLPKVIPRNNNFAICRHMLQKKNCEFGRGGQCQFAHSNEEIEVWTWMINNHVSSLVELVSLCHKAYEASSTAASKPIPKGQSVISVDRAVAAAPVKSSPYASPLDLALNTHYCHYCSVHCNSQKQWDEHCASEEHMFNVNSDKEHQWNYRQPPWGIGGCNYELCDKHMDEGKCRFSEVPDMYNHCKFAHSREELDEWKERWDWRRMKREIAKQEHLYSYMDALREDYETTDQGIAVITDEIDGVTVKCSSSLHIFEQKKNTTHAWLFEIDAGKRELHKVALLYDQDRLHFTLHGRDIEKGCQIAPGECFTVNGSGAAHKYNVEVRFNCGIFGSFSQLIVFDFNDRPVLGKRVNAELGTQFVQEKVKTLREKLKFDRWTSDNRQIVWFDEKQHVASDLNSEILLSYKTPSSADAVVTQQTVGVELNRHNYPHKMHKLLQVEELTQARIMSRLNLEVEITAMERIMEQGLVIARAGELFARVPLTDQLNEDTDAGHLVLSGVSRALLAPLDKCNRVVYEAIIVSKENFDYNGRGRDHIYLCLSTRCCEALNLNSSDCLEVEIQFQLNRLPFCQMHYAVDQLHTTDIVFPDISRVGQTCNHINPYQLSSDVLNEEQMKIIEYIVANREGYNPPLVIYGPFGTGKTETLAQAAMILADNDKEARILICTHSNSAADLYILRHFDAFVKQSCRNLKVLRLYTKERRTNTVPQVVKEYCLMSDDRSSFLEPSRDDVFSHQIVITTLVTSLVLTKKDLSLRGQFSHIFIDEAAQVLECETIMPLSLATEFTTVVLAGDYNQMAQKVYSKEAQRQRFHRSLVHRLFEHYKMYAYVIEGSLPNILLKNNYRTKMEILRFLAAVFYGGPDKLVACSTQNQIESVVPLTFYTAFGREMQDDDSTSYYNMAEIEEIVERVNELWNNWPKEWEEKAAESILVVTPYLDQVQRIRLAMKRKSRELGRVSVDRVSNVQGTEFRAVFISTVRTQHLSEEPPRIPADISECDGEFGDFGFLSDTRLLNTAFTRARSFVAVIGDPVALCAIGECMTIWRTYLKHCQNLKSIHPPTVTLDTIKSHVQNLLNSPVCGPNLQKLCALHEEAASGKPKKPVAEEKAVGREADTDFSDMRPDPNPFESLTLKGIFEDWSLDYRIEPDSIIQHLAGESVLQNGVSGQVRSSPRPDDPLKLSCIRLHEKRGYATVDYVTNKNKDVAKRARQLLTADDSNKDYDSDVDGSSEDENDSPTANVYVDYMPQQLKELLNRQPERFKHCVLKIKDSRNMYARLLNCAAPCRQIRISNRVRCGRAFNNDEVVVEILPVDPEDEAALPDSLKDVPQGQVTGVLRRAYNPKYRMFVCMVEEDNMGLMTPINRSIPKIYNLEPSQRAKKGHVCVYTFTRDKEPVFHHYEPIDPLNPRSKLFIVRYLKWEAKFFGPLGIVIGVLPVGFTIEQAMTILNVEYYIPKKFKDDTLNEINGLYPSNFQIPAKELSDRLDYRNHMTFTVDPAGSKDLDDAISIEDLSNGHFLIGIHIADVSYFVKKGGCIDTEAEKRGIALYPFAGDPIPMLADRLSVDLCSLLPGKDRLTLSVLFTIDAKANIQKVLIRPSVIRSKYRLEYAQLEAVLKHHPIDSFEQELTETFCFNALMLNRVAQIWRRRRLGTAALYHGADRSAPAESPEAHMMIEELMITANHHVAMHLYQKFPVTTPLCCQLPPDALEIDEWKQKYVEEAKNTVALMQPFKHRGEVCNCVGCCDCIPDTQDDSVLVDIRKTTWDEIKSSVDEDDSDRLTSCVISPENHPKTALAMLNLHRISNRSQYFCSGDIDPDEQSHHSLNITFYVHFTSPIRRYVDIVVHRLLKASMDDQPCPYSQAYITDLCNSCTEVALKARCYEKAVETLHYAKLFQEKPVALFPVVESLEDEVQLHFPMLRVLPSYKSKVRFSSLCLSETPVFDEERELRCKWSKRIYDLKPKFSEGTSQPSKDFSAIAVLDNNKYILQTTASDWRELLWSVISSDKDSILNSLMQVDELLVDSSQDDRFAVDVTSEGFFVNSGRQFCDFSLNLHAGNVVQVQVTSELLKGTLVPSVQLFNLTPTLSICLEHRMNAIKCFTGAVALRTVKKSYRNVEAYQDTWLPLLAMEASYNAVLNNECAVIHNVGITWREESASSRTVFIGAFDIPVRFCRERQIVFRAAQESEEAVDSSLQSCYGYFCVQYQSAMTDKPKTELPIDRIVPSSSLPATWVGHCVASRICIAPGTKHYTVELRLVQSSCPPPQKLLQQSELLSTLEWIPKPLPYCRMTDALYGLKNSSQLALDIALGKNPKHLDESYLSSVDQWKVVDVPVFPAANQIQTEAVSRALRSSFTLIQGPPGTGKTVVGARLAYIFAQINQTLSSTYEVDSIRPQVLFCGPSNKSVDVMARYLMELKEHCPRLVRIYSETSERDEFPQPQDLLLKRKRYNVDVIPDDLKPISLHHRIRSHCSNSALIVKMDNLIRSNPGAIDFSIKDYLMAISLEEREVLRDAEVILCTCATSGAERVKNGTNIAQLIVDESGMCMEPETLIPIVGSLAKQIVLIGDHKQLQPIVKDNVARTRGLVQSLFERYSDKALTLTTQYRMHESIAEFSSKYFYGGQLQVGRDEQTKPSILKFWPNGRSKPLAFVHVMGIEQALTVNTVDGNEHSQSNAKEVDVVVRAASLLVRRFHVSPKSVAVLSQYRAQCVDIEKELLKRGEKEIPVSTVVAAQGSEWDYVILSTVRSLPKSSIEKKPTKGWKRRHLGFITDTHQINVALTRAKKGLIIIGNKYLLQCDEMWKKLLRHYEAEKKIVDAVDFMV